MSAYLLDDQTSQDVVVKRSHYAQSALRFLPFGGVSERGEARARGLVLDQGGSEGNRLFQWQVGIF